MHINFDRTPHPPQKKGHLGYNGRRKYNVKIDIKEIIFEGINPS
jgi:hypothetical protein